MIDKLTEALSDRFGKARGGRQRIAERHGDVGTTRFGPLGPRQEDDGPEMIAIGPGGSGGPGG